MSCACSLMFMADSMRGPSLDDRRIFPAQQRAERDVKVFWRTDQPKDPQDPPHPVRASNWKVLPSRGTEAHSVLLLKTSLALYGGEYNVLLMGAQVGCNYSLPYRGGLGRGPSFNS